MKTATQSFYGAAVGRATATIVRSLDSALDLTALAREAALSPFHFHRIFRGMLGETPLEMHRRLRLERAASQLSSTDEAVVAIAFAAGYETHEAFTRAFHQAYGTSPSAFRRAARDAGGCAAPPKIELAARSGVHFGDVTTTAPLTLRFEEGGTLMNVTIEDMPELRVATVPHVGAYNRISVAFGRLGDIAGKAGLFRPDATMLALYYDDPETTPVDQLRSDAGITVPEGVPLPDGLVEKRVPKGRYARTTHVGPYTTLGDTWARLMGEWLPKSGERVGDAPSYELYRNNPTTTRPEDLRTELYLALA